MTKEKDDIIKEFVSDKENNRKVVKYVAWLNYQIGFSGCGTTDLDVKPDFDMPELPENIKNILIDEGKEIAKWRWDGWKKTIAEQLGEDLDDNYHGWSCPKLG